MTHQFHALSVLSCAPASEVKAFVDALLPTLGDVVVLQNRTGIVMLPATDSVKGTRFHIGEVMMAEAHVRLCQTGIEGYGACIGRDMQHALAIAILDATLRSSQHDRHAKDIQRFIQAQHETLVQADSALMSTVAATRVEMETF